MAGGMNAIDLRLDELLRSNQALAVFTALESASDQELEDGRRRVRRTPKPRAGRAATRANHVVKTVADGAGKCDVCGNVYDKAFLVTRDGVTYTFDSFECAIHRLAPVCAHCRCKIVGHGIEQGDQFFCCAHCSRKAGAEGAVDRVA
jgi:hypothetical protein